MNNFLNLKIFFVFSATLFYLITPRANFSKNISTRFNIFFFLHPLLFFVMGLDFIFLPCLENQLNLQIREALFSVASFLTFMNNLNVRSILRENNKCEHNLFNLSSSGYIQTAKILYAAIDYSFIICRLVLKVIS